MPLLTPLLDFGDSDETLLDGGRGDEGLGLEKYVRASDWSDQLLRTNF